MLLKICTHLEGYPQVTRPRNHGETWGADAHLNWPVTESIVCKTLRQAQEEALRLFDPERYALEQEVCRSRFYYAAMPGQGMVRTFSPGLVFNNATFRVTTGFSWVHAVKLLMDEPQASLGMHTILAERLPEVTGASDLSVLYAGAEFPPDSGFQGATHTDNDTHGGAGRLSSACQPRSTDLLYGPTLLEVLPTPFISRQDIQIHDIGGKCCPFF